MWKDGYFQPTSLRTLGLTVQLGEDHPPGTTCIFGQEIHKDFVVIHTNGIHSVRVRSCACGDPSTPNLDVYRQLLRAGLYPATPFEPQACGTFKAMRLFHLLNLQGKLSAYHFYKSLHYYTDNTGTVKIPVSLTCSHCYMRYLLIFAFALIAGPLPPLCLDDSQMEARSDGQTWRTCL